jgi:hypothetical protein
MAAGRDSSSSVCDGSPARSPSVTVSRMCVAAVCRQRLMVARAVEIVCSLTLLDY